MKLIYLLIPLFILSLVCVVSADIRVSPAEPVINGNGYVFVVFNNTSYASQQIYFNITDPNDVAKTSSSPTCNEYGYAKVIYNFTSDDIYGTWHYQTNTTDGNGDFTVGKIEVALDDIYEKTSVGFGESTKVNLNLSYYNFLPKEILCTHQCRDLGTHLSQSGLYDVDGNGIPEIILGDSSGRRYILNYTALLNGTFPTWQSYDFGALTAGNGFCIGDFGGGATKPHLIISESANQLEAWKIISSMDGSQVNTAVNNTVTIVACPEYPVAADIDNDGIYEQVVICATDGSTYFYNYTEAGGFVLKLDEDNGAAVAGQKSTLVADFDNDGYDEYVVVYNDAGAYFFNVNTASGAITEGDQASDRGAYVGFGAVCDWDNDGKVDAILPVDSGRYQIIYYNTTTSTLEETVTWATGDVDQGTFTYGGANVEISDLNCNGRPDFISASYVAGDGTTCFIYFNEYQPSGDTWYQYQVGYLYDTTYMDVTYCDFDGDGIDEFVVYGRYNGAVWIYKYNGVNWEVVYKGWSDTDIGMPVAGDGCILSGAFYTSGWLNDANSVAYDFDGDGREEMIAFPYQGRTLVYEQEDRYECNVSPKLTVSVSSPEGYVYNDVYKEIRLLGTNDTLGIKSNVALYQTDIVDDDGANQGDIASIWADGILSLDESYTSTQKGTGVGDDYATIDASIVEDASWCQIDLQTNYSVGLIKIWNYFSDGREYLSVKVRTGQTSSPANLIFDNSPDGFNTEYTESFFGKSIYFTPTTMRYVRESTAGNNQYATSRNTANFRTEIEIYETEVPVYTLFTRELSDSTLTDFFNVTFTIIDRYGTVVNATETISYNLSAWNYSQDLAWKILNLTDTTILKLSEDGNLAIAGRLYELTNTPPPGNTVAFKIDDNLWLTESGDLYIEKELHEESNFIYYNIIATLVGICILVVNWRIRKRKV